MYRDRLTGPIGRVSLALENEVGGRKSIFSMLTYRTVFFLVVIIGLSPNSVSQLYCSKDNYKQKQRNILPVTMITEIMHLHRLSWWFPWYRRLVIVFGDLD